MLPNERLIITVDWHDEYQIDEFRDEFLAAINKLGLSDRVLVINKGGAKIDLTVVEA